MDILNLDIPESIFDSYINICQCPFCKDGKYYKMLSLHISLAHGISAYEIREKMGWNRRHKLISRETSEIMRHRNMLNNNGRKLVDFNKKNNIVYRPKKGIKRKEAIGKQKDISNKPEVKQKFMEAILKVDRKALALKVPRELRVKRARRAGLARQSSMTDSQKKESVIRMRSGLNHECLKIRSIHAAETMKNRYFNDPDWRSSWSSAIRKGIQNKAKIKRNEYKKIVDLHKNGLTLSKIAKQYGVSPSLIGQIIKAYKLGSPILIRSKRGEG